MIPENGPTVPAWSLPARSRMDCFAAFAVLTRCLQRSKGAFRRFPLVGSACCWILVPEFEVDAGWK